MFLSAFLIIPLNGHGEIAAPDYEARHARFPLPIPPPEGEGANVALREIHVNASGEESDWSIGGYIGQYYDSMPGAFMNGDANFLSQYLVAITASRTVWRSRTLPLSLEIDGMVGHQFGLAAVDEIAIAPVLRWSSFPWKEILQTDLRFGPLGVSYTTVISPLERGTNGLGSNALNYLLIELAFSLPQKKSEEVFLRLHHRCSLVDLLNNYGANGEDYFALGYRQHY